MKYYNPRDVTSPSDYVEEVTPIYDGGPNSFSIAKVLWEGEECLAMRWNIARREHEDPDKIAETKTCVGMPSSHGRPVWFILPEQLLNKNSSIWTEIEKVIVPASK
jgi:hypothetical protein